MLLHKVATARGQFIVVILLGTILWPQLILYISNGQRWIITQGLVPCIKWIQICGVISCMRLQLL